MMEYVTGEEYFAHWHDRARILGRAVQVAAEEPVEYRRSLEERKTGSELTLALVCFLVVACEWFIERRAYGGRGPQREQTG
jgi:hypothetical protein